MSLTIDLYAHDGSPLGLVPADIYGHGVGGAELSMMTWAETMAGRGHTIRIYNNPKEEGEFEGVEYLPQRAFDPQGNRDVFIVYRSPNPHIRSTKAGLKVHWSTDQYTVGDYGRDIVPYVDKIACISPHHKNYYIERYFPEPHKICHLDLGVRLQDYQKTVEKIQHRFIFCSVPERGLEIVAKIWPKIKEALPDATLVITSDHRLWGSPTPNNHNHRLSMIGLDGIVFMGAIPRRDLITHQSQAQMMIFPCIYEELFCVSAAECQVTGAMPLTSEAGALKTTNQYGDKLPGNPYDPTWQKRFTDLVLKYMEDQEALTAKAKLGMDAARRRFDWDVIAKEWEKGVFGV